MLLSTTISCALSLYSKLTCLGYLQVSKWIESSEGGQVGGQMGPSKPWRGDTDPCVVEYSVLFPVVMTHFVVVDASAPLLLGFSPTRSSAGTCGTKSGIAKRQSGCVFSAYRS